MREVQGELELPAPLARELRLSKARFGHGLQCHKQLWWRVHDPDAEVLVPDATLQARFDNGRRVGEAARANVPGGVLIGPNYQTQEARVAATGEALAAGVPVVYEAALLAGGVLVNIDILARSGDRFALIEVKSSTSVKEHHIPDVAVQVWVARQAGIDVARGEVMHLNRECRYPDLSNLFTRADVTDAVEAFLPGVPAEVEAQQAMLKGPVPVVAIGPHCKKPYQCPFMEQCWEPAVAVGHANFEPGLRAALDALQPPLAFLDFETVSPPIPVWDGCRPYDQIPVQFSCHLQQPDGPLAHRYWLADGPQDPRPEIAQHLVEACRGARTVLTYYLPFERGGVRRLAEAVPALDVELADLEGRLADLLPIVRDNVFHPEFFGSYSLKSVLPVLVPELGYDDLAIKQGDLASVRLTRMLLDGDPPSESERAALRRDLLAYCERDTLAMVRLFERLRDLEPHGGDLHLV